MELRHSLPLGTTFRDVLFIFHAEHVPEIINFMRLLVFAPFL